MTITITSLEITYSVSPTISNAELNNLFIESWPDAVENDFQPILSRSLVYICAYDGERLVGFVNVAWDGGIHGFILDTTVHPDARRHGIGAALVRRATEEASARGLHWLHVDYEPHLKIFYEQCGFHHTEAGLLRLNG